MARIETDPNYTSPTFSRATAATDLFKKEDVQNLAAAMSVHDHSTGKGLAVNITDGSIVTADLAANAITNSVALSAAITPSSISNTVVAIAGADVSLTTTGGPVLTFFRVPVSHSAAGVAISMYTHVDGLGWNVLGSVWAPTAGTGVIVASVYLWTGLSAGLHTWQIGWATGSGTMGVQGGGSLTTHAAVELKR